MTFTPRDRIYYPPKDKLILANWLIGQLEGGREGGREREDEGIISGENIAA